MNIVISCDEAISESVLAWHLEFGRSFPWRESTTTPYQLLIAEVLLRQTQASRVVRPYLDLIKMYPTVESLAYADVGELREWFKPLGLTRRADTLVAAANHIVKSYGGIIPTRLEELISLPGLGAYSSRAVLCMGYGAAVPMIDEGSGRLLRRLLDMSVKGPAYSDVQLRARCQDLIPAVRAKEFNLGLLDIASAYCHPNRPSCTSCPLLTHCPHGRTQEGSPNARTS
jgi:A/G-specific adenine glycosylase